MKPGDNRVLLLFRQRRIERQRQRPRVMRFRVGKLPRPKAARLEQRLGMNRNIMHLHAKPFGSQRSEDGRSICCQSLAIQSQHSEPLMSDQALACSKRANWQALHASYLLALSVSTA